jgi:hypothetical protein
MSDDNDRADISVFVRTPQQGIVANDVLHVLKRHDLTIHDSIEILNLVIKALFHAGSPKREDLN